MLDLGTTPKAELTFSTHFERECMLMNCIGFSYATGHFTQMVWKASTRLGVGYAFSDDKSHLYVVAHYGPAGNVEGGYTQNVAPATC